MRSVCSMALIIINESIEDVRFQCSLTEILIKPLTPVLCSFLGVVMKSFILGSVLAEGGKMTTVPSLTHNILCRGGEQLDQYP